MDILFKANGDKNSIDEILSRCKKELVPCIQTGRKEFEFTTNGISGGFQTYYPFPGTKEIAIIFRGVAENQLVQVESLGNELIGNIKDSTVKVIRRRTTNGSCVMNTMSKYFIDSLCLNLRNYSGISVKSGEKELEILGGLNEKYLIAVKNHCKLGEKSLLELSDEAESVICRVLHPRSMSNNRARSKKIPMRLGENDTGWWNVIGTKSGSITGYIEKNGKKHYRAEASTGFRTFKGNFSSFFSNAFLNAVWDVNAIAAINLVKDNGVKRYAVSIYKNSIGTFEGLTSASVTIERSLDTEKMYGEEVKPEALRIANVIYNCLTKDVDLKKAFAEYILNYANATCICGENFADNLDKDVAEIYCYSKPKHFIHASCWDERKKKNKPKEHAWSESSCPFCGKDGSVYNVPWRDGKLIWKSTGP